MDEHGMASPRLKATDWKTYNLNLLGQEEVDALSAEFAAFFATKTMVELYRAACERGLMLAPINTAREVTASAQLAARGFLVDVDHPGRGRLRTPGAFAISTARDPEATAIGIRRPAPRLGEHTAEVLSELGIGPADLARLRAEGVV
jgi:crotonobetainyl-CoA:carnitine CoA-transferase CaiB-like acyl-CoA transferase